MFDQSEYKAAFSKLTASEATHRRILNMTKPKKSRHIGGFASKILIAAVLISLLVVTASAAEYVHNWFTAYFSEQSEAPLSEGQVQFLEENEQPINKSQTEEEWTLQLRSAINDGVSAYILVGVTAPADVDLEPRDEHEYWGASNDPLNYPKDGGFVTCSDTSFVSQINFAWVEDGDGLANTKNMVIRVFPDLSHCTGNPFGSDKQWNVHIENISRFRGLEEEIVQEGTWDFSINFDESKPGVELLSQPVAVTAEVQRQTAPGELKMEPMEMSSFELRPLSATISYDNNDGKLWAVFVQGEDEIVAVGKDGETYKLRLEMPGPGYNVYRADTPIVLENVDHVLFPDGTKIPMPE